MTKKTITDSPHAHCAYSAFDDHVFLYQDPDQAQPAQVAHPFGNLTFTTSRPANPDVPARLQLIAIRSGVDAREALTYVSRLLETAELNGDEIGLHDHPVERAQFWNLLHSVEIARAVVDALLEGAPGAD